MGSLTLIRHGESHANVEGSLYAVEIDSLISLTREGVDHSLALGLKGENPEKFSKVLCSPLHRAIQTAAILGEVEFFDISKLSIDYNLYELSTAVPQEEMKYQFADPFYVPNPRTIHMIYGNLTVGYPRTVSFIQATIDALCAYEDDTLLISHYQRIRAIMAANALISFLKDTSFEVLERHAKEVIQKVFTLEIKHAQAYVIVNEKLNATDKIKITQLLCSLGASN